MKKDFKKYLSLPLEEELIAQYRLWIITRTLLPGDDVAEFYLIHGCAFTIKDASNHYGLKGKHSTNDDYNCYACKRKPPERITITFNLLVN